MTQNEFVLLIAPFKDKVFRLTKRLLVSTAEAADATQEVLLKLWNKNEALAAYHSVEALAMKMTKKFCLDQLKSKRAEDLKMTHLNFTDGQATLQQKQEDSDNFAMGRENHQPIARSITIDCSTARCRTI